MSIKQIGVELEGRWNTRPVDMVGDASLRGFTAYNYVGEVPSPILQPTEVTEWIDANYPDEVNVSCGLHVHVSVETKVEYSLLMSHAAQLERDLIKNVTEWAKLREIISGHALWGRLRGESRWCQPGTEGIEQQVRARGKIRARYKMLNFCWGLHGTVEIRLLPGFKKKILAIEAVHVVIDTIKHALATYSGMPSEIIRETSVGTIECHAWKQGFTCFLDTSAQIKREIGTKLFGPNMRYAPKGSMLARLLKRDRVTIPVCTLESLEDELTRAALNLNRFKVTLTDTREESN